MRLRISGDYREHMSVQRPTLWFRKRRMSAFVDEFKPNSQTKILDIGGTVTNWDLIDVPSSVVLVNVVIPRDADVRPNVKWEQGDGCALPYSDGEFDICFSNSTIEHVHTLDRQKQFAAEVRRVGRSYFVQTPARSFPFEPHWLGFFVHWLPRRVQPWVARYCTLYGIKVKPNRAQVESLLDEYRLLSYREMVELFPDGEIRRERFLLLPKSYVAVCHRARNA
jgi:ubiquinone/menaquinone biosynthesis C-methylase UbiE